MNPRGFSSPFAGERREALPRTKQLGNYPAIPSFPATCAPGTCFCSQCTHWWRKPYSVIPSFPATCAPGTCFICQCVHWWKKQSLKSGSRPEIPQDFRLPQIYPLRV